MKDVLEQAEIARAALEAAVKSEFDLKRRLGQYAVVWQDGKPTKVWFNPDGSMTKVKPVNL